MKQKYELLFTIVFFCLGNYVTNCLEGPFAWNCTEKEECLKVRYNHNTGQNLSLEKCKLICGLHAALMPLPKILQLGKETIPFLPSGLQIKYGKCQPNICKMLDEAIAIMIETLSMYHPNYEPSKPIWTGINGSAANNQKVIIRVAVNSSDDALVLHTDESYGIRIITDRDITSVYIEAPTFFGARHGLETFSQLVDFDDENNSLMLISNGYIWDKPEFTYRGLSIDTARSFINVKQIKKIIRAMSYNKLNTFHWHISDTHSFPLILNSLPNMAQFGAYSSKEVYTPIDVKDIVKYAKVRGIRVLPEIDGPAHAGHGWEWGEEAGLGKLVVCLDKMPWLSFCVGPPCGQLNIANPNIYNLLENIYTEIADLFSPLDMFHYGGDEVKFQCWNSSTEIKDWMVMNGFGLTEDAYYNQWSGYHEEARKRLTRANKGVEVDGVMWSSSLMKRGKTAQFLDKNKYIIQVWSKSNDKIIDELLNEGYRMIFSNYDYMFLDCGGSSSWVGRGQNWCSPYNGWQDLYNHDLYSMARNESLHKQILGGEAALWTEQIDSGTIDARLWPRGAALAERLWTNPMVDYSKAEHRILQHRNRLVKRGISAALLQPEWCRQNQGQCRNPTL